MLSTIPEQDAPERRRSRRSALIAEGIALAAVCAGAITWGFHSSAGPQHTRSLFKAPPVPSAKAIAAASANPAGQPAAPTSVAQQPSAVQPPDAKKRVPRVDLVIHYIADTRGNVEPCG